MRVRLDPRYRSSIALISAALAIAIGEPAARAQDAAAQALFDEGKQWMAEGKLDEACSAFERSNQVEPRAGTLVLLGACRERNHQLASAWAAYRDAVTRAKDPSKRRFAQLRIDDLEARLSSVTVVVPDASQVEGLTIASNGKDLPAAQWNQPLAVDGGDQVVTARAEGYQAWSFTAHVADERGQTRVEVPRLVAVPRPAPAPVPPAAPRTPAEAPASPAGRAPDVDASGLTTRRALGLALGGTSVVAAIVGAALGASAQRSQDDALRLCPAGPRCGAADAANAAIHAGQRRALEANVAFGVAGAALLAAGALWLLGTPDADAGPRVTVIPIASPGRAGLAIAGAL